MQYHTRPWKAIQYHKRQYKTKKVAQCHARSYKTTDGRENIKRWLCHFNLRLSVQFEAIFHYENLFFHSEHFLLMFPRQQQHQEEEHHASFRTFEQSSRSKITLSHKLLISIRTRNICHSYIPLNINSSIVLKVAWFTRALQRRIEVERIKLSS